MGYKWTWSIALYYGSRDYDSFQINHSEVESLIRNIKAVHNLFVKADSNKVINLLFQWYQHTLNTTYPSLKDPPHLWNYVNNKWMNNCVFLLKRNKIKLKLPNSYTHIPQRYNDSFLMNDIRGIVSSKIKLQQINACRLYLNITFLFDITSINSNFLLPGVLQGDKKKIPPSNQI